ncbi:hypothetical protein [Roseibium sp. Sym1]|uniref:hypothetical protein n=1 Tax=Roseibium sp. Sym1 TaxID=3016006 RepID=UPI0022B4A248|nr:hypothetical protein [Roseibium sp. Sym1]
MAEKSENVRPILTQALDGKDLWRSYAEADGEIAVSSKALEEGPDLWVDPRLKSKIFLSGSLVKAIRQAKIKEGYLRLLRCRTVGQPPD